MIIETALFCKCKISQDWMQGNLLAKHSKFLDIAMEKHSRILQCFVASHPQYCQYVFHFPDVSKNFFPLRVVQLVHTVECRHIAEEYEPQIVCRTVVNIIDILRVISRCVQPFITRLRPTAGCSWWDVAWLTMGCLVCQQLWTTSLFPTTRHPDWYHKLKSNNYELMAFHKSAVIYIMVPIGQIVLM